MTFPSSQDKPPNEFPRYGSVPWYVYFAKPAVVKNIVVPLPK